MAFVFGPEDVRAYYVEETNYGETPVMPAMLWIGVEQRLEPDFSDTLRKVRGLGGRDLAYILQGLRAPNFTLKYVPQNINFLEYAIGKIDKSMSLEYVAERGTTIVSLNHQGIKLNRLVVDIPSEDVIVVTTECFGKNLVVADLKIGNTYADDPGTDPLTWYDSYVKRDTVSIDRYGDIHFSILNNLARKPTIRAGWDKKMVKYMREGQRGISGRLVAFFDDKDELDMIVSAQEFALEIGFGSNIFNFNNCKWDRLRLPTNLDETPIKMQLPWIAKGVTLT